MKQNNVLNTSNGSASVTLADESIIICRLEGDITGPIVKESVRQTREYANAVRAQNRRPVLLIDILRMKSQTSEARSNAKDLAACGLEQIAVIGKNRALMMIGRYIARAAGLGDITRFFRTESRAVHWLKNDDKAQKNKNAVSRNVTLGVASLLAISTLAGWQFDVPFLISIISSFKPMNPVTAATLLFLVLGVFFMSKQKKVPNWRRYIVLLGAVWAVVFGSLVLARYFFGVDIPVDVWLFHESLGTTQYSGRVAPSTAIGVLLLGVAVLLVVSGQPRRWQRYAFHIAGTALFLTALVSVMGYAFGLERFDYFAEFISMPLNTACALLLLIYAVQTYAVKVRAGKIMLQAYLANWQAIWVCVVLLFATGIIWQQTMRDIETGAHTVSSEAFSKVENTITARLGAYNDALDGYRGLFAASDNVAPAEFHQYFLTSGLSERYPGFTAIAFIAAVPDAQKQAFIAKTRVSTTPQYPNYKDFTIFPEGKRPVYYPAVYSAPYNPASRYGFDLGSEAVRLSTLETARDMGKVVTSGIINLNASRGPNQPERNGFFISIPLYKNEGSHVAPATVQARRERNTGFVTAYFQNDLLFADLFKRAQDQNVRYVITDTHTGKELYASKTSKAGDKLQESVILEVFGQQWRLTMSTVPGYGISGLQRVLPEGVLLGGLLLSFLAGALVLAQLRRRDQALKLAADMTQDLSNERNSAVATQHKNEAVLSSIGDAVFAIDTKHRITLFNPAAEYISGYSADEAIGKPYKDVLQFLYAKDGHLNDGFIRKAFAGHIASMEGQTVLVKKNGQRVAVADSAAPIHDLRRELQGVIVVFRDVSKEQEVDKAKTEFVSLASHQLRTPLSAINWYAELLLSGDVGKVTKGQRQYIQEIFDGNQRMIELVNALLDVSRLDLGKLTNKAIPINLNTLVESLEKELATTITGKNLAFTKNMQPNLPTVIADPKLLRMILQNLLSNAVKYTPAKGSVELIMRRATELDLHTARLQHRPDPYVYISVRDTGYGIPKDQQSKIFSKLFRADNVRTLDVEGTGLGLYIVKEVSEKLGGRVWFESDEGQGAIFHVVMPVHTKVAETGENG